jgi:phosphoglycolate phosphatase-like HAD superfamily hydrolase
LLKQSLHVLKVADPAAALAVGDTPYDALAAKSAGMRACGVLTGGFSKPSLQDAGCEYIFDQLQHLRSLWRIE